MLEKYKNYLISNCLSQNTIRGYVDSIRALLKQVKIENLTKETLSNYFIELRKNQSGASVNKYKSAVRSFLKFLNKDKNIVSLDEKLPERLPKFITEEYLKNNIIPVIESVSPNPMKMKAILYFMFYTGLRIGEIHLLKRENIDLKKRVIKFYMPKVKKERLGLIVSKKASIFIQDYFSVEPENINAFNINSANLAKWFQNYNSWFKDINFHPHLLRHCVSEDTEILTLNGWKKYNELKIGEKVFNYNLKKDIIELTPLLKIFKYKYQGIMYNLKNRYIDSLVSPEHKNIFKIAMVKQFDYKRWTAWRNKWELLTISELLTIPNKRLIKILVGNKYKGNKHIKNEKAYLLGLILTDGNIHIKKTSKYCNITIAQSLTANPNNCIKIEHILQKSGLKYSNHKQKYNINKFTGRPYRMQVFRILKGSQNWIWKYLTKNNEPILSTILQLKKSNLKEIFNAMMLADGSRQEFCDQNPKTIELLRIIAVLLGYRTLSSKNNSENKYRTYISYKNNCNVYLNQIQKINYKGIIWCPSTKNKTWIAKRNNKIFITGNSFATYCRKIGMSIEDIKELMGHSDIRTTMIYAHVNIDDIKKRCDEAIKRK